ncbi:MAG: LacI family DNA-binding transcriptional regulator [Actinomyces sp.]|nr:LacI family DNA-binding transcriptional regulator [Actinomyces sp.]MDU2983825.1 LacI family DNA-binding transcriptional regulator [Actinomyces sp.]
MAREKQPTVYEVAEAAGVSIATVSFAFRKPEKVKKETLDRVHAMAEKLGYFPSETARGLATGETNTYGFYAFDMLLDRAMHQGKGQDDNLEIDPFAFPLYIDEVQRGFQLQCSIENKSLLVSSGPRDFEKAISGLVGRVDGLAAFPGSSTDRVIERIAERIPVVLFNRPPVDGRCVALTSDNALGISLLVNHLVQVHGYRTIEYVGKLRWPDISTRFTELQKALRAAHCSVPPRPWSEMDVVANEGVEQFRSKLRSSTILPDAFVCGHDQIALSLLEVLNSCGLRVPEDVAVVGFDGILATRLVRPTLTTVRQPMVEMGRIAVQILRNGIEAHDNAERLFEPRLLIGQSCGC